jgi:hypothetical protein
MNVMNKPICFSAFLICFLLTAITSSFASTESPACGAFEKSQIAKIEKLIEKYGKPTAVDVIRHNNETRIRHNGFSER